MGTRGYNILFHLGLSTYDSVIDISMDIDSPITAEQQYESDEVVCPLILLKNLHCCRG